MRRLAARFFILTAGFCLALSLLPNAGFAADRRPYFKTFGGDVMSGGWFKDGAVCDIDPASNYQDGRNSVDHLTGGILAYARSAGAGPSSAGGSSSQFAAFVLGLVDNSGANFGFYSNGAMGGAVGGRTFANNAAGPWGGYFQDDQFDGVRQSYCIPDYYSKKPADASTPVLGSLTSATGSGTYRADGTGNPYDLNLGPVNLPLGSNITVFVNGNVYIGHNISYNPSAAGATVDNVPKLTVVARGSIYISPNVTDLYGFYIAQPLPDCSSAPSPCSPAPLTADTGIIWTCHPDDTAPLFYTWPITNGCDNRLVITGGLAAKQVNFLRIRGDIGGATSAEDSLPAAMASGNIAEIINYSPAIAIDGPFFSSTTSSELRNRIDSVISLPPVF